MFDSAYILAELEKLDGALERKLSLYIVGGAAMSFYGMKTATKDVDIIVKSGRDLANLTRALEANGYSRPERIDVPYRAMRAGAILENKDEFRWDIFAKTVCGGLSLSSGMEKRAGAFGKFAKVDARILSPEDIFVFKAVTSRPRDRDDMFVIFSSGLDFGRIKREIASQSKACQSRAWVAFFLVGLDEMIEKHGAVIPGYDGFLRLAEKDVYEKLRNEKRKNMNRK